MKFDQARKLWVVILAAGDGTRVQDLSRDWQGERIPKQYCHFGTETSLLQRALSRAKKITDFQRILCIVSPKHRKWWSQELHGLPRENVIVQPQNRGTAAGILLPLLAIRLREEGGRVLFLPSDHFVEQEGVLQGAVEQAFSEDFWTQDRMVLLGVTPETPDSQYGYIQPRYEKGASTSAVARFVEKPDRDRAQNLLREGALWNSFMFGASSDLLLRLFEELLPELGQLMGWRGAIPSPAQQENPLEKIYQSIPTLDFSKHLLERAGDFLEVFPVPACGWSDLGTPERLYHFWESQGGTRDTGWKHLPAALEVSRQGMHDQGPA